MEKYICTVCDYVYDPDWVCPLCGVGKEEFEKAS